jgi:Ni/Co efflux regulator RcnB
MIISAIFISFAMSIATPAAYQDDAGRSWQEQHRDADRHRDRNEGSSDRRHDQNRDRHSGSSYDRSQRHDQNHREDQGRDHREDRGYR